MTPDEKRAALELAIEALKDKYLAYCDFFDPNRETKQKVDRKYNDTVAILEQMKAEVKDE